MREYNNNLFGYENTSTDRQSKKSVLITFCFCDSNGLSLVSTLWILTILSVLAMQLLYSFQLENNAKRNYLDRVKYHYAAKSGFELGLATLRTDETNFDSLGETWAEPIQEQIEDGIQTGRFLTYQVTITDEASKININSAPEDTIRNLLTLAGAQPENNVSEDLANRIVEGRPYRTVRDLARINGVTQEILYGIQQQAAAASGSEKTPPQAELAQLPQLAQITQGSGGLVTMTTVYSVDRNTDANGQQRVNINTAQEQQLRQIRGGNNQSVFSQGEANAIIQEREFSKLSSLLDVQAISDDVFNNISEQITVEDTSSQNNENDDGEDENKEGGGRNGNQEFDNSQGFDNSQEFSNPLTNINTADSGELQELQGIDNGIADRIIAHRDSQGDFQNIDAIKDVKILTVQEFAGIVDTITINDGQSVNGLININTAPVEVLQLLPGMDQQKAQAIITRREEEDPDANASEEQIRGNPFSDIGQILDLEDIDDQAFREVVDWVTYRSHGYRIESSGVDETGKILAMCVGIVVREGNQLSVPYWRQD